MIIYSDICIKLSFQAVTLSQAVVPFLCTEGGMILAADYSQLELRVLAHLSKDQRLLQVVTYRGS